jgi:hypothetical protein
MSNISRKSLVPLVLGFGLLLISGLIALYLLIVKPKGITAISKVIDNSEWAALLPFIIAQSQLETANFTSNVYKSSNNLFGMKVPSKRPFLGVIGSGASDGGNYAKYSSDVNSVRDYLEWLRYTNFPTRVDSAEHFVRAMKSRGYFTANESEYLKALNSWLKK